MRAISAESSSRINLTAPLVDIPLTIGVIGVLLAPQLAAIGAIAALVTNATIVVEIVEEI